MPPDQQTPPLRGPRRTRAAMWLAMTAVVATTVIAVAVGVREALLLFAAALAALAVVRAVSPAPGPYGIATRSRAFDVTVLAVGAVVIAAVTVSLQDAALG